MRRAEMFLDDYVLGNQLTADTAPTVTDVQP